MKHFFLAVLFLWLLAGCVSIPRFAYKPGAPATGKSILPMKIAVIPFVDATEDFTTRGSIFAPGSLQLNLVKAGIPGTSSALTPDFLAKSFADDLTAAGDFQSVRFIYSLSELVDELLYIEGTIDKAYGVGSWDKPNEITLVFRALQKTDKKPVWEKKVVKVWTPKIVMPCGVGIQCVIEQRFADVNKVMQSIFAEARTDLVRTLAPRSESRTETDDNSPNSSPASSPESVDRELEGILKGD